MAPTEMKEAKKDDDACTSSTSQEVATKNTPIGSFGSIDEYTKNGIEEIVDATRAVNAFPQGRARDLYCAHPTFGRIVDEQSDRILGTISKILKWQNIRGNIERRQPDEQFDMLLECNDAILERLSINLDDLAGVKKTPISVVIDKQLNAVADGAGIVSVEKGVGSWNLKKAQYKPLTARLITATYIARPQMKFKIAVDNNALTPFMPKLKEKPNSKKPLAILPEYDDFGNITSYLHPYEFELMRFEVPDVQLIPRSPETPPPVDATELVYVSSVEQLKQVLEELRQHKEIAVDVEHHSYRTFLGITCLVQISTRSKDYIFDALELREELHVLNEVFTDPNVVKIFHGSDRDVEWLQRDLSIYLVNMFDTHQAAKALNFARLSLAFLLKHYCQIEADKTFQLSDWRIRPLPAELLAYARQDTHFLIYIFDRITNDLLDAANQQSNLLNTVYQHSTELCKKRYVKPLLHATSHIDMLHKSKRTFDNRQLFALKELYQWRDLIARQEDESCGYVLPNHMLLQIAELLPREMQGVLACCNPIPTLVRQHVHALHHIVLKAREQPLVKPVLETESTPRVVVNSSVKNYSNKLYCPHDFSHRTEFRNDLPTVLGSTYEATNESEEMLMRFEKKPTFTVFENSAWSEEDDNIKMQRLLPGFIMHSAITPYQRYLAVLPYAEQEKREEAMRIEAEMSQRQLCPGDSTKELSTNQNVKLEQTDCTIPAKKPQKRKHEQSANATKPTTSEMPPSKRIKAETPTKNNKLRAKKGNPQATNETAANDAHSDVIVVSDDSDGPPDDKPSTSRAHQPQKQQQKQQPQLKSNQRQFKRNRRHRNAKSTQHKQSSNNPVAATRHFDFQNVDAKKFRGGAQRARGTELKPQFHGKGNSSKANNKKFNKLFTFSNVKGKK